MTDPPDETNAGTGSEIDPPPTTDGSSPRIELLHRIAAELRGCSAETAVYDAVITAVSDLFDVRDAVIVIPRDDRWVTITKTSPTTTDRSPPTPLTGSRVDPVIDRAETIVLEEDESVECGQTLCTPIGDTGMLQLFTDESDGFDESDRHAVELLGWIVDAHLDRLTLNEDADSIEEQLDAFVDFHHDVLEQALHELRTPLTPILGYTELLADEDIGSLTPEQKELARLVLRKAIQLDAALENLTSAFAKPLEEIREGAFETPLVGQPTGITSFDGTVLLLGLDERIAEPLADQLGDIGNEVTIADSPTTAREAIRTDPPAVLITELFTTNGDGIELAETLCREEACDEPTIIGMSTLREDPTGMPQLGVSAALPEDVTAIVEAAEALRAGSDEGAVSVLVFDAAPTDGPIDPLPTEWDATVVTDLDAAREARQENGYDLAIVRTDGLSGHDSESEAVRILRERRCGRRLPVILVDRSRDATELRFTLGGTLFVQRPLTVSDLVSMLVSTPTHYPDEPAGNLPEPK